MECMCAFRVVLFRVPCFVFRVSGRGFRTSCFGFQVSGSGLRGAGCGVHEHCIGGRASSVRRRLAPAKESVFERERECVCVCEEESVCVRV